jgi:hypothetical protein
MKSICLILTSLLFSQWLYVEFGPANPVARVTLTIHNLIVHCVASSTCPMP